MILNVEVGKLKWTIPIERRITVVRGNSGSGKTEMVRAISEPSNIVKVDFPLQYVVATFTTWRTIMSANSNTLIIFDDMEVTDTEEFAKILKDTNDSGNYYLIISRDELNVINISNISVAVNSILRLVTDDSGYIHYTVPYFKSETVKINNINIDIVLTEDKGNGRKFFSKLFSKKKVISSESGKSAIVSKVLELNSDKVILLFVDMAAYGCHMDELYNKCHKYKLCFDTDYECFEELLLRTNFFSNNELVCRELSNIEEYANKFLSWEKYFEDLLYRASLGLPFETGHEKKLNFCWKNNCNECNRNKNEKCNFYIDEDKMVYLLSNTKYSKLLVLR